MGVKGLWKLLSCAEVPASLSNLRGMTIALDISIWIERQLAGWSRNPNLDPVYLRRKIVEAFFIFILTLLLHGACPVAVYDGRMPALKAACLAKRRASRARAAERAEAIARRQLASSLARRVTEADGMPLPDNSAWPRLVDSDGAGSSSTASSSNYLSDASDVAGGPLSMRNLMPAAAGGLPEAVTVDVDLDCMSALPVSDQREVLRLLRKAQKESVLPLSAPSNPLRSYKLDPVAFSASQSAQLIRKARDAAKLKDMAQKVREATVADVAVKALALYNNAPSPPSDGDERSDASREAMLQPPRARISGGFVEHPSQGIRAQPQGIRAQSPKRLRDGASSSSSSSSASPSSPTLSDSAATARASVPSDARYGSNIVGPTSAVVVFAPNATVSRESVQGTFNVPTIPADVLRSAPAEPLLSEPMDPPSKPLRPLRAVETGGFFLDEDDSSVGSAQDDVPLPLRNRPAETISDVQSDVPAHTSSAAAELAEGIDDSAEVLRYAIENDTCNLLRALKLPFVIAPGEADAQCGAMSLHGIVDAVASEDSDVLLFGASVVIRGLFTKRGTQQLRVISMNRVSSQLGLSRMHLILLACFLGSDYCDGIKRCGISAALCFLATFPLCSARIAEDTSSSVGTATQSTELKTVRDSRSRTLETISELRNGYSNDWMYPPAVAEILVDALDSSLRRFVSWCTTDICFDRADADVALTCLREPCGTSSMWAPHAMTKLAWLGMVKALASFNTIKTEVSRLLAAEVDYAGVFPRAVPHAYLAPQVRRVIWVTDLSQSTDSDVLLFQRPKVADLLDIARNVLLWPPDKADAAVRGYDYEPEPAVQVAADVNPSSFVSTGRIPCCCGFVHGMNPSDFSIHPEGITGCRASQACKPLTSPLIASGDNDDGSTVAHTASHRFPKAATALVHLRIRATDNIHKEDLVAITAATEGKSLTSSPKRTIRAAKQTSNNSAVVRTFAGGRVHPEASVCPTDDGAAPPGPAPIATRTLSACEPASKRSRYASGCVVPSARDNRSKSSAIADPSTVACLQRVAIFDPRRSSATRSSRVKSLMPDTAQSNS